jgi:hypothetical protein
MASKAEQQRLLGLFADPPYVSDVPMRFNLRQNH